jgi:hypothetical protein
MEAKQGCHGANGRCQGLFGEVRGAPVLRNCANITRVVAENSHISTLNFAESTCLTPDLRCRTLTSCAIAACGWARGRAFWGKG